MARRKKKERTLRRRGSKGGSGTKRKLMIWSIGSVVGLIVMLVAGYFWLLSWLQGDGFREQLQERLSNKAKTDFYVPAPLSIQGGNINLHSVEIDGTGFLKEAEVKGISTEIKRSELLNRFLYAPVVNIKELNVRMDSLKEAAKIYPEDSGSSFFSSFTPNRYLADRVECGLVNADITFRRSDTSKPPFKYNLKGSTLTATPLKGDIESWQIKLRNGTFSTSHRYLAKSSIRYALFEYANDRIELNDCQLALTKGNMDLTGAFGIKDKSWNLNLSVGNADVERLLSEQWREILTGEFSGTLKMSGKRRVVNKANGQFSLRKGRFKALSFLTLYMSSEDRADKAFRIPGQQAATDYLEKTFNIVEISQADCDIRFPHADKTKDIERAWLFDNIDIRTKDDSMRMVGHVIMETDGKLHGTLKIGINNTVIEEFLSHTTLPFTPIFSAAIPRLFNATGDAGFRWVNINLSGTQDAPQQDLSARVKELTRTLMPDSVLDTINSAAEIGKGLLPGNGEQKDSDEGTNRPASLLESATDTASDIIDSGLKAIPFF